MQQNLILSYFHIKFSGFVSQGLGPGNHIGGANWKKDDYVEIF
jgi:hypothetical protein